MSEAPEVEQGTRYAPDTRVRLLKNVDGTKEINNQLVNHTLAAGTIAFIRMGNPINTRTSTNTLPVSVTDYLYKLRATLVENVPEKQLEGPYIGINEGQKIRHTALDTDHCPPSGAGGMYGLGQKPHIRHGNQYTYQRGSQTVTLRGGDIVNILAKGTTKSGGPVTIANNAYYLKVQKVNHHSVPKQIEWRSDKYLSPGDHFEVVDSL